jgi:hypothetical protein
MYFDTRKLIKITKTSQTEYAEFTSNIINYCLYVNTDNILFYVQFLKPKIFT